MAAFVASTGADLVALQEVPLASIEGMAVDLPALFGALTGLDYRYGAVSHAPLAEPDGRVVGAYLWGNVILSRLPIASTINRALPVTPNDDPTDPIDDEPRSALACAIDTPNQPVTFVSTHLAYLGLRARLPQAGRLAELAVQTEGPLILAGDLNAPIESEDLAPLRAVLDDGFAAVGVQVGDAARESCGTERIDHVLTRGVEVLDCRVAREAGDASDHWPVIARLRLSGGAGPS